jgi:hypothetical protein
MMPLLFSDLAPLVRFAKLRAQRGVYDGRVDARSARLLRQCAHLYSIEPDRSARLIYTRDAGHHSSGWWKNPDYERCLHLSISFCVNPTDAALPFDRKQAQRIAEAFFEGDARKCWVEPPYSPEGKHCGVHHYRLFCDLSWMPLLPRGEVHNAYFTEAGWRSFSEVHGDAAFRDADAPWLKAAST